MSQELEIHWLEDSGLWFNVNVVDCRSHVNKESQVHTNNWHYKIIGEVELWTKGETPQLFSRFYVNYSEEVMRKVSLEQNRRSEQDKEDKKRW